MIARRTILTLSLTAALGISVGVRSASAQAKANVNILDIILTKRGINHKEIRIPAGKTMFIVHNRSGRRGFNVNFDHEVRGRQKDVPQPSAHGTSVFEADLSPGVYILRDPGFPGGVCRITVTAQ
jgi:hypothetical protein